MLCVAGLILGQFQDSGRNRGESDFLTSIVQSIVGPAAGVISRTMVFGENIFTGVRDANRLKRENDRLRAELLALERYRETVDRLREQYDSLLRMHDLPVTPKTKVYASIVGYFPEQNAIMIDRGSNDGIEQYMPVVASEGLVGIIEVADPKRSRVLLVTSRAIRIASKVEGEPSVTGIIHGETTKRLVMDLLEQANVAAGSAVVTSGHSESIPAGIPIGTVIEAVVDQQFGQTRVIVVPHMQMGEINEVYVLK